MAEEPEMVTVSLNLPAGELAALRELAEDRGVPLTQALRQAIATERFISDLVSAGNQVLVKAPDGKVREVTFVPTDRTRRYGMKTR
jgi:hypothetical protein